MNKKVEKFDAFLKERNVENWFTKDEVQDQVNSVVYRGFFNVGEQQIPTFVVLDDTVFNFARLVVTNAPVPADRREEVSTYLNDLNSRFKIFKYYVSSEDGFVYLDVSYPAGEEFEPGLLMALLIEVVEPHIQEFYAGIIDNVLGTTKAKPAKKGRTNLRVKKEKTTQN
ncbi:MAG: YbjN domain-containing protein [Veillonella caviae]|nr:YbjN domain-containing protein [Veillonella caviae]